MSDKRKITQRQAKILAAIVKEYCDAGNPVSSKELVEKNYFDASGATIRNEMRVLEKNGLIFQPHTSAGRMPTDIGYRYFITQLMKRAELSAREQARLQQEVKRLQQQHYELGRTVTRLLAETSHSAAFAFLPEAQAAAGLSNIISPDIRKDNLKTVASFLENLDENCKTLVAVGKNQVQTYVGAESPIPLSEDVSMMVTAVKLPNGGRGVVGIVGSKRIKYAKNISLLEYVSKLISGGGMTAMAFLLIK